MICLQDVPEIWFSKYAARQVGESTFSFIHLEQNCKEICGPCHHGSAGHTFILLAFFSCRTNRTHLKDGFYAVGALTKGKSTNADYEDDLDRILGVESVSDITFFSRLQIGEAVLHSKVYKRGTRRNNYTIAYQQEENICYGQIEVFFVVRDNARMVCRAVLSSLAVSSKQVCKSHDILGSPVSHIVCLHQPNRSRFTVVPLDDIIDVCVYMKFSDCDLGYAALFANHIERD